MTFQFAGVQLSISRVAPAVTPAEAEREYRWDRMYGEVERQRMEALCKVELDGLRHNVQ